MTTDAVIAQVRETREELTKRFNYDLRAMIEDARKRQAVGGRKVVSFPPRRPTWNQPSSTSAADGSVPVAIVR